MKILKALFSRLTFMIIMIILEIGILLLIFHKFQEQAAWIEAVLRVLSLLVVLFIIKNSRHLSSDMIWIMLIMLAPVPGTAIYLLLGANKISSPTFHRIVWKTGEAAAHFKQDEALLEEMGREIPDLKGQFNYISRAAGYPFYRNTGFDYYELGDIGFPVMLEEMRKAKKFIFLEYFIIEKGELWDSMLEVLEQKAAEGLDIRVLYDDLGSFFTLPASYARKLEGKGIQCIPFNRINPIIGVIANHRDHRKIMVIDGETAFSGGINLADEYINKVEKFGHWKDNVIRIKGEAVWSFTLMFLAHWNALRDTDRDFEEFHVIPEPAPDTRADGFIAPYGETPLDDEITAQNIYMNILDQSNDYCYIYTPYLIIDTEMINALILTAKRGVDVRIVTPGIPDKWLIWQITRSYYKSLIKGGVRIFEYKPGFVHSKVFLSDDRTAVVGTINLDYRSLYHHFENGTYIYGSEKIRDIRNDFQQTFAVSEEKELEDCRHNVITEFVMSALRILAPLL